MNVQYLVFNITISTENTICDFEKISKISSGFERIETDENVFMVQLSSNDDDYIYISNNEIEINVSSFKILTMSTTKKYINEIIKIINQSGNIIENCEYRINIIYDTGEEKYIRYFEDSTEDLKTNIIYHGYKLFMLWESSPVVTDINPIFNEEKKIYVTITSMKVNIKSITEVLSEIKKLSSQNFLDYIDNYVKEKGGAYEE